MKLMGLNYTEKEKVDKWFNYFHSGVGRLEKLLTFFAGSTLIVIGILINQSFIVFDDYILTSSGDIDLSPVNIFRLGSIFLVILIIMIISGKFLLYLWLFRKGLIKIIEGIIEEKRGYHSYD